MASKQASTTAPKKGRNPIQPADVVAAEPDSKALAVRHGELQDMAKAEAGLKALAVNLRYAGELDPESLWAMVEYRQRRSVEDILEMGRGLLLLKEQTPHGEFLQQCAARSIHPRAAQRLMGVALKFSKNDTMSLLKAAGTQAKVLELAVLDDEELQALEAGESVAGITLDELELMSASQLRETIRELRADADAKDQRISKLSDDVNKAEEKAVKAGRKWKTASPDDKQITLEQRVVEAKHSIVAQVGTESTNGLLSAMLELADHCNEHKLDCSKFMGDTLDELIASIRGIRDGYNFGFDVSLAIDSEK